jgi:hypothetical protein
MIEQNISHEKVKLSHKSIDSIVSKSILKDSNYNSRILFAGPKDQDTIVVFRLLELMKGRYALEQIVINTHFKSVQTTMATLNKETFHKYIEPEKLHHSLHYSPNIQLLTAISYARQINNRTFSNIVVRDHGSEIRSYWRLMSDCYLKYKMKRYLNKRI